MWRGWSGAVWFRNNNAGGVAKGLQGGQLLGEDAHLPSSNAAILNWDFVEDDKPKYSEMESTEHVPQSFSHFTYYATRGPSSLFKRHA